MSEKWQQFLTENRVTVNRECTLHKTNEFYANNSDRVQLKTVH
jgi:hypothetical protein